MALLSFTDQYKQSTRQRDMKDFFGWCLWNSWLKSSQLIQMVQCFICVWTMKRVLALSTSSPSISKLACKCSSIVFVYVHTWRVFRWENQLLHSSVLLWSCFPHLNIPFSYFLVCLVLRWDKLVWAFLHLSGNVDSICESEVWACLSKPGVCWD